MQSWQENPPYNLDAELYEEHLAHTEFKHRMWNAGPCFWWPELKRNDALNEHFLDAVKTDLGGRRVLRRYIFIRRSLI